MNHYNDVIMGAMSSQITSITIVYSIVYSGADQRKHQSAASLAFVWANHRWPANSLHKGPETRTIFPFDDVNIVNLLCDYFLFSATHGDRLMGIWTPDSRLCWQRYYCMPRFLSRETWRGCYSNSNYSGRQNENGDECDNSQVIRNCIGVLKQQV